MFKLVLDTDVVFAAFDSAAGASRKLFLNVLDGHLKMVVSTTLLVEYEAVLTRKSALQRFKISARDVTDILDELVAVSLLTTFDYRWRPETKDADDDHVLETAINGGAHAIATFNVGDYGLAGQRFGIIVDRPASLLHRRKS